MHDRCSRHPAKGVSSEQGEAGVNGESLAWALEAFSLSRQPEFWGLLTVLQGHRIISVVSVT